MLKKTVELEIADLANQPIEHLKDLWDKYYATPPPKYNRATLISKIAYRMQELEYGGLKQATINTLLEYGTEKKKPIKRVKTKFAVGTTLMREYRGKDHYVTVIAKGYTYEGKIYKTLSAVARHITGSNWNGNAFFGITRRS